MNLCLYICICWWLVAQFQFGGREIPYVVLSDNQLNSDYLLSFYYGSFLQSQLRLCSGLWIVFQVFRRDSWVNVKSFAPSSIDLILVLTRPLLLLEWDGVVGSDHHHVLVTCEKFNSVIAKLISLIVFGSFETPVFLSFKIINFRLWCSHIFASHDWHFL